MKKIATFLGLALVASVLTATSAFALTANHIYTLTANHTYTVQLHSVSTTGQSMLVTQMDAGTDANGKLNFQFNDVPDSSNSPFLMVQIMDNAGGQLHMVRQTLVPAPTTGQQMEMGVSEISHRQTQAALTAMQSETGTANAALRAMFPLTMIPTGAINDTDAGNFGQAANDAATSFHDYLVQQGVTSDQMTTFQNSLLDAMRTFATSNKNVVDQTNSGTAASLYGQTGTQFMMAMIQAGDDAGIDPTLIATAFDQAGQAIDNSPALIRIPAEEVAAMQASFMAGAQQRRLFGQMHRYASALPVVGADPTQLQTFTNARTALQDAMVTARQNFCQQAFADPTLLPDPTTIDTALTTMTTAMQTAFDSFNTDTTADATQITGMLGFMAGNMNTMGGMMGGMMTGSTLSGLNLGMMQTSVDGTIQNWSTMMVASTNLLPSVAGMDYTPDTSDLTSQLTAPMPTEPDWTTLPAGPDKSLLQLQYDLMLVHLIDLQMEAKVTPPLTQSDLALVSDTNRTNRAAVRAGLQGLTAVQEQALMATMSPVHQI